MRKRSVGNTKTTKEKMHYTFFFLSSEIEQEEKNIFLKRLGSISPRKGIAHYDYMCVQIILTMRRNLG